MCLYTLALLSQHPSGARRGSSWIGSRILLCRRPHLSLGDRQQPTKVAVARIMEHSSAASPTPVEAAAAPNPAPEASNVAPLAATEASALPAGAAVAPPRFDLHAAPDANLNLRLSPSEDGWGGATAAPAGSADASGPAPGAGSGAAGASVAASGAVDAPVAGFGAAAASTGVGEAAEEFSIIARRRPSSAVVGVRN